MHEARTSSKHERRSRIARGRLLVSFYQTLSRVPSVYLVVLPTNVVQLLRSFKLVSLGHDSVPLECLGMPPGLAAKSNPSLGKRQVGSRGIQAS